MTGTTADERFAHILTTQPIAECHLVCTQAGGTITIPMNDDGYRRIQNGHLELWIKDEMFKVIGWKRVGVFTHYVIIGNELPEMDLLVFSPNATTNHLLTNECGNRFNTIGFLLHGRVATVRCGNNGIKFVKILAQKDDDVAILYSGTVQSNHHVSITQHAVVSDGFCINAMHQELQDVPGNPLLTENRYQAVPGTTLVQTTRGGISNLFDLRTHAFVDDLWADRFDVLDSIVTTEGTIVALHGHEGTSGVFLISDTSVTKLFAGVQKSDYGNLPGMAVQDIETHRWSIAKSLSDALAGKWIDLLVDDVFHVSFARVEMTSCNFGSGEIPVYFLQRDDGLWYVHDGYEAYTLDGHQPVLFDTYHGSHYESNWTTDDRQRTCVHHTFIVECDGERILLKVQPAHGSGKSLGFTLEKLTKERAA